MKASESAGSSDYKYYPIPYPNKVLSTHLTLNEKNIGAYFGWVLSTDKTKYLCGINNDWATISGNPIVFNVISIGL